MTSLPSGFLALRAGTAGQWSITPACVPSARRIAFPHMWHAAEAVLSLLGAGIR